MKLTGKQMAMLAVLVAGTFVAILNQTVVTPALPSIMAEMAVDASTAQWLTTGFTLVNAIMIPITAFLTDKYSTRGIFTAAMGVFTVGSVLCGVGANFPMLLAGRLLQAAGAGILMPMVQTVLMLTFPPERRGSAMGLFGLVIAFAPAIGPSVAGVVVDNLSWHDLFYAIAVFSAVMLACGVFMLEKQSGPNPAAVLDKLSVVLSSLGFGLLLYGLSSIGSNGINAVDLAVAAAGVVIAVLFFVRQLKLDTPMLNVAVLKNRKFLVGTVIGMLVQASLLVGEILMPIYLQDYLGVSATTSGLIVLPGAIVMGVMGIFVGRLFDKHGPRMLSLVGLGLLTACTFAFSLLGDSSSIVYVTVLYTLRMFAMSLVNMPILTWAMNALSNDVMNHGTSVSNTLRQVAGSLGTAVLISISTAAATSVSGSMDAVHAGIFGTDMAYVAGTVLCCAGLVVAFFMVKDRPGDSTASDPSNARRSMLEQVIKRDVYTLPDTATVLDAIRLFVEKGVGGAPIVDARNVPVGFISDGDVTRYFAGSIKTYTDPMLLVAYRAYVDQPLEEKLDRLMEMNVLAIATHNVKGIDIHTEFAEVCRFIGENHLKKVAVTENGYLVGVINRSDIARHSMEHYLARREERGE